MYARTFSKTGKHNQPNNTYKKTQIIKQNEETEEYVPNKGLRHNLKKKKIRERTQ